MGLIAAGPEIVTGTGEAGLGVLAPVGTGVGGVFATVALIYTLAYLDLLDAVDDHDRRLRRTLVGVAVPLGLVFTGIVFFEVLQVLLANT